jgi:uncharacterized SAM-binding protein YcdF (DUF218 family)
MYYVNKIIGWMLSPMGIVLMGFLACAVCALMNRRRMSWVFGIMSVAFLWIFGCAVTTRFIGRTLESAYEREGISHDDVSWAPQGDVIVILGGGMWWHEKCGAPEMFQAADRVWTGAKLYKAGKAPKIICTGSYIEKNTLPLLLEFGVPREAVVWYDEARNTEEEACLMAAMLGADGKKPKVLLVTSAWHMNRARFLFEKSGLDVVPCPGDFEMSCTFEKELQFSDFFPHSWAFQLNTAAVREWVGIFAYRLLK